MKKFSLLIFTCWSAAVCAQLSLNDSLQACYDLAGNSIDAINGLNGVNGSVTSAADRNNALNECYSFNGTSSSIITLPDDPRIKAQVMTVSAWAYPTAGAGSYIVFAKNNFSAYHEAYCLSIDYWNSIFNAAKVNNNGVYYAQWTTNISLNTWYHLVTTVDQNSVSLYVNGVLQATTFAPGPIDYEAGKNVQIGGSGEPSFPAPFSGKIDNVRFYNRILSSNEIVQLYTNDPPCMVMESTNDELYDLLNIAVFPNPANDILNFQGVSERTEVRICDAAGKLVMTEFITTGNSSVDISGLAPGIYIASLQNHSGKSVSRIVRQ